MTVLSVLSLLTVLIPKATKPTEPLHKKNEMSTHRFILEPYKGIATRHTCPECHKKRSFARYIDTEGKIEFPPYVGRCNHEQSCGYHFTPKDFFEKNPEKNILHASLCEIELRCYHSEIFPMSLTSCRSLWRHHELGPW